LDRIVDPHDYAILVESSFTKDVAREILAKNPQLNELEQSSIEDLFKSHAIKYVLDNYDVWKSVYPITDILTFLRGSNNDYDYIFLAAYPQLFQDISFSDQEFFNLAHKMDNERLPDVQTHFFRNYPENLVGRNIISVDRLITIGTEKISQSNPNSLIYQIFLPHFNYKTCIIWFYTILWI
jgi:hypothetical protein